VPARIAIGLTEGVQLFEIDVVDARLLEQLAACGRIQRLAVRHQAPGKRPHPLVGAALHLDQERFQDALVDGEDDDVDGNGGKRGAARQLSSSMRRNERSAATRTSSSKVTSNCIFSSAARVPSRVIIFMN